MKLNPINALNRYVRSVGRTILLNHLPPYRQLHQRLEATVTRNAALERERASLLSAKAALEADNASLKEHLERLTGIGAANGAGPGILVTRGNHRCVIAPVFFDAFAFQTGDELTVIPAEDAAKLPRTCEGHTLVEINKGYSIQVPSRIELFEFKGFQIPVHLVALTGAGPETLDQIGKAHVANYQRFMGLQSGMTILELGCGIGRDAFQLIEILDESGRYIGVDVTRDSIAWCQRNISARYKNFSFHHFDAVNELYNPLGTKTTMDFQLPVEDGSVDRIFLASVFTHLLEDEIIHYMSEFRRVLKPTGLIYASFFLYSEAAIAAAQRTNCTPWKAKFDQAYGGGFYGNDPNYPRAAVAFTDEAMRQMIGKAGLRLVRSYIKGSWSGLHDEPQDGQDAAILGVNRQWSK
jgi:ubiquinone/menaquinone biosynthesis C-methylase UbiE